MSALAPAPVEDVELVVVEMTEDPEKPCRYHINGVFCLRPSSWQVACPCGISSALCHGHRSSLLEMIPIAHAEGAPFVCIVCRRLLLPSHIVPL